jgi:hypothetical protein
MGYWWEFSAGCFFGGAVVFVLCYMRGRRMIRQALEQQKAFVVPQQGRPQVAGADHRTAPAPGFTVPDPSGARAGFYGIERRPLLEISADHAREIQGGGKHKVYGHPFDPVEIERFDKNGFQMWAVEGYRFEAVRFYTEFAGVFPLDRKTGRYRSASECPGFEPYTNNAEVCRNCDSNLGNHAE